MRRRRFLFGTAAAIMAAGPAMAQSITDRIVAQLRDQGYEEIRVSRTWLGRAQIRARSGSGEREIIVNPRTGEILRDYWDDDSGGLILEDDSHGGDEDDEDDDDSSGHGGGDDDDSGNGGDDDDDSSGHGSGGDDGGSGHGGDDD